MANEKEFKGWIILNWKSGAMRVKKVHPMKNLKASEIPIEVSLTVVIPDKPLMKVSGKITLGEQQIKKLILEAIEEEDEAETS